MKITKNLFLIFIISFFMYNVNAEIITYNTDNWNETIGNMLEHGDAYLRAPPNNTIGLVSYWNPDTDVGSGNILTDIWGINDGTIHGATWNMTSDMLEYDGINDFIDCGNDESLAITSGFTYISKFKTVLDSNRKNLAAKMKENPNERSWSFEKYSNNRMRFDISYDGTNLSSIYSNEVITNNIIFSGVTFDGVLQKMYLDGVLQNDIKSVNIINAGTQPVIFGRYGWYSIRYFNGSIGKTYIYNISLTNTQINETNAGYHNITSYLQINKDAGFNNVFKNIQINGINTSSNITMKVLINTSDDNISYNGWKVLENNYVLNNSLIIPFIDEYRYIQFKIYSNTTYQPETNIIHNIKITTIVDNEGLAGYWILMSNLYNNMELFIGLAFVTVIVLILGALGLFILKMIGIEKY